MGRPAVVSAWRWLVSRTLWCCLVGLIRPCKTQEGTSIKRLFGLISTEQTEPDDSSTRAKYQSSCYAGVSRERASERPRGDRHSAAHLFCTHICFLDTCPPICAQLEANYFDGSCWHERSMLQGDDRAPMPDEVEVRCPLGHHSSSARQLWKAAC